MARGNDAIVVYSLCILEMSESLLKPTVQVLFLDAHRNTHTHMQTHRYPFAYFRRIGKFLRATLVLLGLCEF